MSNNTVELPIEYYPDPTKGRPVFNGKIFIGNPDTDPEILANRKNVILRQEDGTDVPIAPAGQPLLTGAGGVILYDGSPVQVLTEGNFSIKVLNKQDSQVYYVPNVFNGVPLTQNNLGLYGWRNYTTVAEANADTSAEIGQFFTCSDYAAGHGAGILFFERVSAGTGTPDGGSYFDHDTLSLQSEQVFNDKISIKQFGAATILANNGSAVQNCINYCIANSRKTYVPDGSYLFTTGVTAQGEDADRFTIEGESKRGAEFRTTSAITILTLAGTGPNTFQYPTVYNMTFVHLDAGAYGIKIKNTENAEIDKNVFSGTGVGLGMSELGGETDIKPRVKNNIFGNGLHGILGGDTRQADVWIIDNTFINCTVSMMTLGFCDGGTITGNKLFSDIGVGNSVRGFNLKKPIYVDVVGNDFFELGGEALVISSPRYSEFSDNNIVNCGQNAAANAISIFDFDASVEGIDVKISNNTIKDCNGGGININSTNSLQKDYIIKGNYLEDVGDSGVIYDGITLINCSDFDVFDNKIKSTEPTNKTRFWLNLNNSTNIHLRDNAHENLINPDVFRTGTCTMIIKDSRRIHVDVTATQTMNFDDDGVIGGVLTSSIFINLPAANACPGKIFTATKSDVSAFSLILDPASTQTIDGAATRNVSVQYETVTIISDGSNWITIP